MVLPTYDEFRTAPLEQKKVLLQRVKLTRIQHRVQDHHDENLTTFYDCATCGVIEKRIKDFEEELYA